MTLPQICFTSVDVGADIPTAPFSMLRHPSEFWATVEQKQQPCKRNLSGNGTISGITMKINSQKKKKKKAGYRLQCGLLLPLGQACNYIQLSDAA